MAEQTPPPRAGARALLAGATETVLPGTDGSGEIRRTVLPGGIRVITEAMPSVRSVTLGVWVGVGSRDEGPESAGASHYLEHLLFKGTARRSALDISASIEAVGGEINAFTTKEYTCYYARVLDADLPLAADVVTDVVAAALIRPEDVESERGVILEEIAMTDDDPGDVVHDEFALALFGDSPLGRPIAGTVQSVKALTRNQIAEHYHRHYTGPNLVVAAAGNLDHDRVVELIYEAFQRSTSTTDSHLLLDPALTPSGPRNLASTAPSGAGTRLINRKTEQAHLVLGMPGVHRTDDRRWALGVLAAVLGGGMSSRLFQEVREKRGLAYSVYSYASQYADAGAFGVYAGCQPKKLREVIDLCRAEIANLVKTGITESELALGIGQLRGGMVLGLEDTGSRMSRLGKGELVYGEHLSVDAVLDLIAGVTLDDVRAVTADLLTASPAVAVIGPYKDPSAFIS
ncbi:MAG TPA: pitrilysin family protein [Actinocrinis sp.]|uniref:M16 family metallopeptidase n=1 Tax=Actinocrinis sp. TaxID=1920516 RepID=UPI002DDCA925|nr:pitrilysin family protein [Actinocrinis sp.]HEV2344531.1 pitrilysin family protein [Actinocrinis sp.]